MAKKANENSGSAATLPVQPNVAAVPNQITRQNFADVETQLQADLDKLTQEQGNVGLKVKEYQNRENDLNVLKAQWQGVVTSTKNIVDTAKSTLDNLESAFIWAVFIQNGNLGSSNRSGEGGHLQLFNETLAKIRENIKADNEDFPELTGIKESRERHHGLHPMVRPGEFQGHLREQFKQTAQKEMREQFGLDIKGPEETFIFILDRMQHTHPEKHQELISHQGVDMNLKGFEFQAGARKLWQDLIKQQELMQANTSENDVFKKDYGLNSLQEDTKTTLDRSVFSSGNMGNSLKGLEAYKAALDEEKKNHPGNVSQKVEEAVTTTLASANTALTASENTVSTFITVLPNITLVKEQIQQVIQDAVSGILILTGILKSAEEDVQSAEAQLNKIDKEIAENADALLSAQTELDAINSLVKSAEAALAVAKTIIGS